MPTSETSAVEAMEQRLLREQSPLAISRDDAGDFWRYPNAPASLAALYRKASILGGSVFVVHGDERYTYGDIFLRAKQIGAALESLVLPRGERIVLAAKSGPAWIAGFIAITSRMSSAVLTPDDQAIEDRCALTQSRLILTELEGRLAARDRCSGTSVLLEDGPASGEGLFSTPDGDNEALIAFTSGSTGRPKGAIATHQAVIAGLSNMMFAGALAGTEITGSRPSSGRRRLAPSVLLLTPLSHIGGYGQVLLAMMTGAKLVFAGGDTGATALAGLIAAEKCTAIAGIQAQQASALAQLAAGGQELQSLAAMTIVGASAGARMLAELEVALPNVSLGSSYGLTETCGSVCAIAGSVSKTRPQSCGRIVPAVECRITNDDGDVLGCGQTGRIWLRGAMLMRGYCGEVAQPLADGWLDTGDIGYLSADRHLHLVNRQGEMLNTGNGPVSIRSIETAAAGYLDIVEAAFVPGPLPTVFVLPHADADLQGLHRHLESCFPGLKCRVVAVAEFPRTLSGKIDRQKLVQQP